MYVYTSVCVIPGSGTAPEERSCSSPPSKIVQLCPDKEKETQGGCRNHQEGCSRKSKEDPRELGDQSCLLRP